ncbi:hypothetical protein BJ322DRAFT_346711 [Thelephora terrestris]|uniref:Uncharacterized protein n=1 Tax=Thelephora terrestris TaxID=56493 RepID=A0A9P6L2V6_9AGAM|nr:hypothetical protein BJ322DRAFT_346711 [Thelephora terrestris]
MARVFHPGWAIYKEQLDFLGHGDALWEPSPTSQYSRVKIGDVGFLRRGRLFLLYSAASPLGERRLGEDVPNTFEQLDVGTPEVTLVRQPGCLRTNSVKQVYTDHGGDATSITSSRGAGSGFSFELKENRSGAALVTNYETYRVDATIQAPFEEYTKRHYDSWVALGHDKGYSEDVRPVLVTGFDVTRDFEMVAYSDEDTTVRADVVTDDSGVAVSHSFTERTRSSPHIQKGPWGQAPLPRDRVVEFPSKSTNDADIPEDFNRCVFVRYYTMRKSPERARRMSRAGQGPRDLGADEDGPLVDPDSPGQLDDEIGEDGEEDSDKYGSDNEDYDLGCVVHNVPSDEDYDNWATVADYVFKNSDAVSVLMHHRDLAGIRTAGDTNDLSILLDKHKPRIVVDESGVGRIIPRDNQQPEGQVAQSNAPNGLE